MRKTKKYISIILILMLLVSSSNFSEVFKAYSLDIGADIVIKKITFTKTYDGFKNLVGGTLTIVNKNLSEENILFGTGANFEKIGTVGPNSVVDTTTGEGSLQIIFNGSEVDKFDGRIRIGIKDINILGGKAIPSLTGIDKVAVNIDGTDKDLTISGVNLNAADCIIEYGKGINKKVVPAGGTDSSRKFTAEDTGKRGLQNLYVKKRLLVESDVDVDINYEYKDCFRLMLKPDFEDGDISFHPTVAKKGDMIVIESDKFKDDSKYDVYFLDYDDNTYDFSGYNRSPYTKFSSDYKKFNVKIPDNAKFKNGKKKVLVTKVEGENREVVSVYTMTKLLTVTDANYAPVILKINPDKGPADKENVVQISGVNILRPAIPSLEGEIEYDDITGTTTDKGLELKYKTDGLMYDDNVVGEMTRLINITISKPVKFYDDFKEGSEPFYGKEDVLNVITQTIDGVEDEEAHDVLIEIKTVLTVNGKKIEFINSVKKEDGYTFVNSSVVPEINKVTPNVLQVVGSQSAKFNLKNKMLISIEGNNFFVNKFTKANGDIITNKPKVFIQDEPKLGLPTVAKPAVFSFEGDDVLVLDDDGNVVTGTSGKNPNEIGTRIIVFVPNNVKFAKAGAKHIQVINPKRDETVYNSVNAHGLKDAIDFVTATDSPVISTVVPDVVAVDGNSDVVITGSNFAEGVKVYIDGILVDGVVRENDPSGTSMLLKFKAPKRREGETQIEVINPSGASDTRKFYYVKSLGQDPVLSELYPNKGTFDTLVVAKGDNFVKPDPTVDSATGLNVYKLVGSRVRVDGKDVNKYNIDTNGNIEFRGYQIPNLDDLLKIENGKVKLSRFASNTTIKNSENDYLYFTEVENKKIALCTGSEVIYVFGVGDSNKLVATDNTGNVVDVTFTPGTPTMPGDKSKRFKLNFGTDPNKSVNVIMDNHILREGVDKNNNIQAVLADYAESVILKDQNGVYYTLTKHINNDIVLTNGRSTKFKLKVKFDANGQADGFVAVDKSSNKVEVTRNYNDPSNVLQIGKDTDPNPIKLSMITAYVTSEPNDKGAIVGHRTAIVTKNELKFYVPILSSGTGLKDVEVINPDIKNSILKQSFDYYHQPGTRPVITNILPNSGSVKGGYYIKIKGSDFYDPADKHELATRVYIGSQEVPYEDKRFGLDGKSIEIKVPEYPVDISAVFGVGEITVPVTVVNSDGASYSIDNGFRYVKPASAPVITRLSPAQGSSSGYEIVDIYGEDFRFFEPYTNIDDTPEYTPGVDSFVDLNAHLISRPKAVWDDLLQVRKVKVVPQNPGDPEFEDLWEPKPFKGGYDYFGYKEYYSSKILPSIYFGSQKSKIVEFGKGHIRVITPKGNGKSVNVRVMNNDSGVSNPVEFKYESTKPVIDLLNPQSGSRVGSEVKELFGKSFYKTDIRMYDAVGDDTTEEPKIDYTDKVDAVIRFGNISNEDVSVGQKNDGRIIANTAVVNLEGGLKVDYNGNEKALTVSIEESGKTYSRKFKNFDEDEVYIPVGLLKTKLVDGEYYIPMKYPRKETELKKFNKATLYELIKVKLDEVDKRMIVSRGYSPYNKLKSNGKVELRTPSYYTVDTVDFTFYNVDGGNSSTSFTYANPASQPIIVKADPMALVQPNTDVNDSMNEIRIIEASYKGQSKVEITGRDFRDGLELYFGDKPVKILDIENNEELNIQTIIAEVPAGTESDVNTKLPIIVKNKDGGIAISTDENTIEDNTAFKRKLYFVYRKPLSGPKIDSLSKDETSAYGGNTIRINGSDFRKGAKVIVGTKNGIPILDVVIGKYGKYIDFVTPKNLKPGTMDVEVVNDDFGTSILTGAFRVVSYPEVNSTVYAEDGQKEVNTVSLTGGKVVMLKGKSFMKGAEVYIGGSRISAKKGDAGAGLFKDDKYYMVKDAVKASSVKFVDENTLLVTMPKIKTEKELNITILNPDGGISDGELKITYALPKPSTPSSLKVKVVNNRYIKLYDYKTEGVSYYRIYAYIGNKSTYALQTDGYRDFKSLGTTSLSPYKIKHLKGFNNLKLNERINFVVKGVNEFGSSEYSNIAYLTHEDLKDVLALGDEKSPAEIALDKKIRIDVFNHQANIKLESSKIDQAKNIDFRLGMYGDVDDINIFMPRDLVINNHEKLNVKSSFVSLTYSPNAFSNAKFIGLSSSGSDYVNLNVSTKEDRNTSSAKSRLARGLKPVSTVVKIGVKAKVGGQKINFTNLKSNINLVLDLNHKNVQRGASGGVLYYYDVNARRWQKVSTSRSADGKYMMASVNKAGYYMIVKNR